NGRVVLDEISITDEQLKNFNKIEIIACGSAYHVGVVAKYVFEKILRKPVEVDLASEFRYREPIVDDKTLAVVISQSGETADTREAMKEAQRRGAHVISIVNVVGSSIASESDDVIYTWAGPEIAVATTKAYSTQLAVIYLMAIYFGDKLGNISEEDYKMYISELEQLPDKITKILENKENIQYLASKHFNSRDVFFIGRNIDYALSLEGSLKLKEISYIHSEAYAAGELKHGTISLIEDGTLVIALATHEKLIEKIVSNIEEVQARGADVVCLACENHQEIKNVSQNTIFIPEACDMVLPSLAVIPLQLFAYYVASLKGCDIDKPRNLAKSVTVE
ncbi:MAG: glutamine--fructose-6-phosphate transaminase (isomerizing), partial [Acutalibacteraceae bacterium]